MLEESFHLIPAQHGRRFHAQVEESTRSIKADIYQCEKNVNVNTPIVIGWLESSSRHMCFGGLASAKLNIAWYSCEQGLDGITPLTKCSPAPWYRYRGGRLGKTQISYANCEVRSAFQTWPMRSSWSFRQFLWVKTLIFAVAKVCNRPMNTLSMGPL